MDILFTVLIYVIVIAISYRWNRKRKGGIRWK